GILLKPFGRPALSAAMTAAYVRRRWAQDTLVYLGDDDAYREALERAVRNAGETPWRRVVRIGTPDLDRTIAREGHRVGAILIQPGTYAEFSAGWLPRYKKPPHGMHTVLVALSREPRAIRPIRAHCHFFEEESRLGEDCPRLLRRLATRALTTWDRECLGFRYKAAFHRQRLDEAEKLIRRLAKLDPDHNEVLCFAGDLHLLRERTM